MKTFTKEELARNDGKDGKPVYIAHKGNVYDVSDSKMWRGGQHMKRHNAGADLTTDIQAAPHDTDVLKRYPQVGVIKIQEEITRPIPGWVEWIMGNNPFFRRHPHPMTVHFPIAFMLSHPVFLILFLVTGNRSFETTAFHCLGAGLLFLVVAIATGLFTWWYNYMARMMKPVAVKIPLSIVTVILAAVLFIWRINAPEVMAGPGFDARYFLLSLSFVPLISIIGWYGATMTFPIEKQ